MRERGKETAKKQEENKKKQDALANAQRRTSKISMLPSSSASSPYRPIVSGSARSSTPSCPKMLSTT